MMPSQTELIRRLRNALESNVPLQFLIGSGATCPVNGSKGVPLASEIVARVRGRLPSDHCDDFDKCVRNAQAEGRSAYQAAFEFVDANLARPRELANSVIRDAVLDACEVVRSESDTSRELAYLERDTRIWHLRPGLRALAALYAARWPSLAQPILTTNFDPLLGVALRREDLRPLVYAMSDDNLPQFQLSPDGDAVPIVHLHGYWHGTDTLHSALQLRGRKTLEEWIKRQLSENTFVVFGYGGWDDCFMSALEKAVEVRAPIRGVIWCLHDAPNEYELRNRYPRLDALLAKYASPVNVYRDCPIDTTLSALHGAPGGGDKPKDRVPSVYVHHAEAAYAVEQACVAIATHGYVHPTFGSLTWSQRLGPDSFSHGAASASISATAQAVSVLLGSQPTAGAFAASGCAPFVSLLERTEGGWGFDDATDQPLTRITSLVLDAFSAVPNALPREVVVRGIHWLLAAQERGTGMWAFSRSQQSDILSTAHAVSALAQVLLQQPSFLAERTQPNQRAVAIETSMLVEAIRTGASALTTALLQSSSPYGACLQRLEKPQRSVAIAFTAVALSRVREARPGGLPALRDLDSALDRAAAELWEVEAPTNDVQSEPLELWGETHQFPGGIAIEWKHAILPAVLRGLACSAPDELPAMERLVACILAAQRPDGMWVAPGRDGTQRPTTWVTYEATAGLQAYEAIAGAADGLTLTARATLGLQRARGRSRAF